MHRVDLCRATGRPMMLTAEHDGGIVAEVACDWADRYGRNVSMTLTGTAGYVLGIGESGEELTMFAVKLPSPARTRSQQRAARAWGPF